MAGRGRHPRRRRDPRRDRRRDRGEGRRLALGRGRDRPRLRVAGADRRALPDRPPAGVRGDVDRAARLGGRRRRPRRPRARGRRGPHPGWGPRLMHGPEVAWYLILASLLFVTGANLALISFSRRLGHEDGQVFAIAVMAVAASEVVVGLGLIVALGRRELELDVDKLRTLRG